MHMSHGKNRKFDSPVNTKWLKISGATTEYMIISQRWAVVQNPSKIGSHNFAEEIAKFLVVFLMHTQSISQSVKFFHLVYISQIWKDLKHLWLRTWGFTPRCTSWGYFWWQSMFRGPNSPLNWIFGHLNGTVKHKQPKNVKHVLFESY